MADYAYIAENIKEIRERMQRVGADENTRLMAVTKYVDVDRINYAIDHCGIRLIGENRVQELTEKYDRLHLDGVEVHLIGTLQTNKVKYVIDKVDMIQSLDSLRLAQEIQKQAGAHGRVMDCLIEVNIGREANKGGVMPEELFDFWEQIRDFQNLRVCGLMTIAPFETSEAEQLKYFTQTKQLFDRLAALLPADVQPILSMGMSDSMEAAIRAGSDMIRIGTAIFGSRNKL